VEWVKFKNINITKIDTYPAIRWLLKKYERLIGEE
jgi:hypothetical protein